MKKNNFIRFSLLAIILFLFSFCEKEAEAVYVKKERIEINPFIKKYGKFMATFKMVENDSLFDARIKEKPCTTHVADACYYEKSNWPPYFDFRRNTLYYERYVYQPIKEHLLIVKQDTLKNDTLKILYAPVFGHFIPGNLKIGEGCMKINLNDPKIHLKKFKYFQFISRHSNEEYVYTIFKN